jgi:hypothetical protein
VRFLGVREHDHYQIKTYSILHASQRYSPDTFESGFRFAASHLPRSAAPPASPHPRPRPGLAFAILHQGLTGDYFILAWWDRENELPLRVFVREPDEQPAGANPGASAHWRPASATNGESICIWDLHILWHERQAYIATLLNSAWSPNQRDEAVREYLARGFEGMA